jgi:hypothetical protein
VYRFRRLVHVVAHPSDEPSRRAFLETFGSVVESASPAHADGLTPDLSSTAVTVVLVGAQTWRSKWVDWSVAASLRPRGASHGARASAGLVGILLPSYRIPDGLTGSLHDCLRVSVPRRRRYAPNNLPPRLMDQVDRGFASVHPFPSGDVELADWLDTAAIRRAAAPAPRDLRALMVRDRRASMPYWRA